MKVKALLVSLFLVVGLFTVRSYGYNQSANTGVSTSANMGPVQVKLLNILQQNDFQYNLSVDSVYMQSAERVFRQLLADKHIHLSPAFWRWLNIHKDLKRALYMVVYPPDTRIAVNIDKLINNLGPRISDKYAQLIFACAVARRQIGVGAVDLGSRGRISDVLAKKSGNKRPGKNAQLIEETRKKAVAILQKYMQQHHKTALELWKGKKDTLTFLAQQGLINGGDTPANQKKLQGWLTEVFIKQGKVPAKRDPYPNIADFIRHLIKIEHIPVKPFVKKRHTVTWPMFPLNAPWPVLMPLAQTVPLREANYIWDKFQGKYGDDRLHTYGPYVHGGRFEEKLVPGKWNYHAYPALIKIGGVCGTMSSIAKFALDALGVPCMKCGQPGHSCLFKFNRDKTGYYFASLAQAVHSPYETHTPWLLADATTYRAGKNGMSVAYEYYSGMALAVNGNNLDNYLKSRVLVNLYKSLPTTSKKTTGVQILKLACKLSPYNVEPWYFLNEQYGFEPEKAMELVTQLRKELPVTTITNKNRHRRSAGNRGSTIRNRRRGKRRGKADISVTNTSNLKDIDYSIVYQKARKQYVDAVCYALLAKVSFKNVNYSKQQWQQLDDMLKKEQARNSYGTEIAQQEFICKLHLQGPDKCSSSLQQAFNAIISSRRVSKGTVTKFVQQLTAYCKAMPAKQTVTLLRKLNDNIPDKYLFNLPTEKKRDRYIQQIKNGTFKIKYSQLGDALRKAMLDVLKTTNRRGYREYRKKMATEKSNILKSEKAKLLQAGDDGSNQS